MNLDHLSFTVAVPWDPGTALSGRTAPCPEHTPGGSKAWAQLCHCKSLGVVGSSKAQAAGRMAYCLGGNIQPVTEHLYLDSLTTGTY